MRAILGFCVLAILSGTAPARCGSALDTPFDAGRFEGAEIRLIEAALAASGDYDGTLDGVWTRAGDEALAAWSDREFGAAPRDLHAAAAVGGLLDAVDRDGWREVQLDDLGVAMALPVSRLGPDVVEAGGVRRWTTDGGFAVLTHRFSREDATLWHRTAAALAAGGAGTRQSPDRMLTAGTLADGRAFYTRSDLLAGEWSTVFLSADPSSTAALRLAAASLHAGRPEPLDLPAGGRLARLIDETASLVRMAGATPMVPTPASFDTEMTALPPADPPADLPAGGTGTGFYVGPNMILTADHVVAGCTAPALVDGTPLERLAGDATLDVAILSAPRPARRWLALADGRLRLGQRVHAVGFPYYSIAGTSLTLTGGNVSALAGIDDDRRFFSFTAPVQPGSSGGPLLDAKGRVLGLVVARLSEDYIVEATGSLPQNVNYALREDELSRFLAGNGLVPGAGGLARFDPDDGVPDDFESAIVPILCR